MRVFAGVSTCWRPSRCHGPITNLAGSVRSISNGFTHFTVMPMHAFGILTFVVEWPEISWTLPDSNFQTRLTDAGVRTTKPPEIHQAAEHLGSERVLWTSVKAALAAGSVGPSPRFRRVKYGVYELGNRAATRKPEWPDAPWSS